jgi:hypothetical protein
MNMVSLTAVLNEIVKVGSVNMQRMHSGSVLWKCYVTRDCKSARNFQGTQIQSGPTITTEAMPALYQKWQITVPTAAEASVK